MAPSRSAAKNAMTFCGQFGSTSATRSPFCTPRPASAVANRSTESFSSRYVIRVPRNASAVVVGNDAAASSSSRVSGTSGKSYSAGTSGGYDASHGFDAYVILGLRGMARILRRGRTRLLRHRHLVERQPRLGPREHHEEQQRDRRGDQRQRADELAGEAAGQVAPDPD